MEKSTLDIRKIYTYNIMSHGEIAQVRVSGAKEIPIIHIPPQVELFTYTNLGTVSLHYFTVHGCNTVNYICGKNTTHPTNAFDIPRTPLFKYIREFAEIYFTPEITSKRRPMTFYSGIIHCIPETRDDSSTKTKEIIHNMDADPDYPREACSNESIHPYYVTNTKIRIYDSDKNYSTFYKTVLATNKHVPTREPPLEKINKCGPLYLSEAIQLIQQHCKETYTDYETSIIQIHISGCLRITEPYDDHTNESYKTTQSLEFFDLHSVSDPKILDTPTTKVFVFILHGIKFIIKISKSKAYNYDYTLYPEKLYFDDIILGKVFKDSLYYALDNTIGLSRKNMKNLPKTLEITIPEEISIKQKDVQNFLRDYFRKQKLEVSQKVRDKSLLSPVSNINLPEVKITQTSQGRPWNRVLSEPLSLMSRIVSRFKPEANKIVKIGGKRKQRKQTRKGKKGYSV
jgi:hypothetical protein